VLDSNLVLVLSIGALLVANGLIARVAAARRAASNAAGSDDPTVGGGDSA
jgi:hypothetical protein